MNKKVNTALFIVGATVGTTLLALILIIIPTAIMIIIMKDGFAEIAPIAVSVIFLVGIVGSFLIYSFIMKKVTEKVDMEKYFHPILVRKKRQ